MVLAAAPSRPAAGLCQPRAQAAQLLGISVRNLYRKIEALDLHPPQ
ncbi:MAG: helix-turn-helix domain-containing protein [Bacillota bacterium]